jgi:hypothetical protein
MEYLLRMGHLPHCWLFLKHWSLVQRSVCLSGETFWRRPRFGDKGVNVTATVLSVTLFLKLSNATSRLLDYRQNWTSWKLRTYSCKIRASFGFLSTNKICKSKILLKFSFDHFFCRMRFDHSKFAVWDNCSVWFKVSIWSKVRSFDGTLFLLLLHFHIFVKVGKFKLAWYGITKSFTCRSSCCRFSPWPNVT